MSRIVRLWDKRVNVFSLFLWYWDPDFKKNTKKEDLGDILLLFLNESHLIHVTEKSPVYTTITNLRSQGHQIQQEMVCPDFVSSEFHFPRSVSLNPKRYWTILPIFHEDVPWATGETLSLFLPRPLFLCRPTCMGASCLIVGKCPFSLARTARLRASGQACTAGALPAALQTRGAL